MCLRCSAHPRAVLLVARLLPRSWIGTPYCRWFWGQETEGRFVFVRAMTELSLRCLVKNAINACATAPCYSF